MRRLATLSILLAGLSACGFQPVNAPGPNGDAATAETAQVRVQPIPDRMGQILHSALTDRLQGGASGAPDAYALAVSLDERIDETGFRLDETATRRNITVLADYRLIDTRTRQTVLNGRAQSTNSANVLDQPYATEVAEREARKRGVTDLAEKIFRDVATKLAAR
jgi:LPS-assembly lipoprotein